MEFTTQVLLYLNQLCALTDYKGQARKSHNLRTSCDRGKTHSTPMANGNREPVRALLFVEGGVDGAPCGHRTSTARGCSVQLGEFKT